MREKQPEIVFLDIWMPGSLDGIEVLTKARAQFPEVDFVMISGHGTIETAVKATKLGAWDFIEKPLSMDKILIVISNIQQYQSERDEKKALLNKLRKSIAIIGETAPMVQLKQMIARTAPTQSWVLLQGEKGSGRELIAQNIHYLSSRASRPFIEINCASISMDLMEAELFGYEKGAFPGAERSQKGKLELAHGGTVYIEDIADLSLSAQEKLLKVLQERTFQRLGGSEKIPLDIRLVAATNEDLQDKISQGLFLESLYHRMNVMPIRVPSLRERREDIPALISHFGDISAKEDGQRKKFSEKAILWMREHSWPGNVRELKNFIERLYILTPGDFVDVHDVRFAGLSHGSDGADESSFREARAQFEKEYLVKKLAENNGNISKTAEVIGLERSYLHRKIKTYGIEVQKGSEDNI
jgi:two-component system nitrogen regulation response regulator NtrX